MYKNNKREEVDNNTITTTKNKKKMQLPRMLANMGKHVQNSLFRRAGAVVANTVITSMGSSSSMIALEDDTPYVKFNVTHVPPRSNNIDRSYDDMMFALRAIFQVFPYKELFEHLDKQTNTTVKKDKTGRRRSRGGRTVLDAFPVQVLVTDAADEEGASIWF